MYGVMSSRAALFAALFFSMGCGARQGPRVLPIVFADCPTDLDALVGKRVQVFGIQTAARNARVCGIGVRGRRELTGKRVVATGIVKRTVARGASAIRDDPIATRAPGVYYDLIHDRRLAEAHLAPEDAKCDDLTLRWAVSKAMAAARAHGVLEAALEGCASSQLSCDGPVIPDDASNRCRARVERNRSDLHVHLRPAAVNGAPYSIHVVAVPAMNEAGIVWLSGDRWASSGDGTMLFVGIRQEEWHEHGGEPAKVGGVHLHVFNTGPPRMVTIRAIHWTAYSQTKALAPAGPVERLVPSGVSKLDVSFPLQEAYQAFDDVFTAEIEIDMAGEILHPRVGIEVSRFDVQDPE